MRFNWNAVIGAVALMHDDEKVDPVKGTGFSVTRGERPGDFVVAVRALEEPKPDPEP